MLLRIGLQILFLAALSRASLVFADEAPVTDPVEEGKAEESPTEDNAPNEGSASPKIEKQAQESIASPQENDGISPLPPTQENQDKLNEPEDSAEDLKPKAKENKLSVKKKEKKKKWRLSGSGHFTEFFTDLVDPSLGFNFSLVYLKNKKTQLSVSQSITKLLVKNQGEDEIVPQDTLLRYSFKPKLTFFGGGHASLGSSLKLPISEYSRKNGVWTSLGLNSSLTWYYLNKTISNTAGASGTIYLNQYRTKHEDFGGSALPYLNANFSWNLAYSGHKDLVYSLSASYGEIRYYNIEDESFFADTGFDHPYSLGLNVSYQFDEALGFSLSYGQSNVFEQYGNIDYYIFDEQNSNLSLSVNYAKSF